MWRPFLVLATLALTITTSAALTLTLTRNTSLALVTPTNITNSALEPPADPDNSVGSRPWPKTPYNIRLRGIDDTGAELVIGTIDPVRNLPGSLPTIKVSDLQHFLRDFADRLRQDYPVPGFIPRESKQFNIDVTSNTRWLLFLKESYRGRVPTAVALAALDALEKEMGKYEVAEIRYYITKGATRVPWSLGGIFYEQLMGASFNDFLSNKNDNLQTA